MRQLWKIKMDRKLLTLFCSLFPTCWVHAAPDSSVKVNVELGQLQELELGLASIGLKYGPDQGDGFATHVAYEYLESTVLPMSPTFEEQSLSQLRVGLGYRWQWLDFYLVPKLGVVSNLKELPEYQLGMWKIQSFAALTTGYQISPNWATFLTASYDSGHEALPESALWTLGVSYRFGGGQSQGQDKGQRNTPIRNSAETKSTPTPMPESKPELKPGTEINNETSILTDVVAEESKDKHQALNRKLALPNQVPEPSVVLSPAKPMQTVGEEFKGEVTFTSLKPSTDKSSVNSNQPYYSVQVGSFKKRNSIIPFLDRWGLNPEDLNYREEGAFTKVSFGRYETKAMADLVQAQLADMGISCFVIKLPRKK